MKMKTPGGKTVSGETEVASALEARLREGWLEFARTEQAIARYLLANIHDIPFETGATIAAGAGVSEASVTRFVRRLGYTDLKEMKRGLRSAPKVTSPGLDSAELRFRIGGEKQGRLARSLEMEQQALAAAYGLAQGEMWSEIVHLLSTCDRVNCVSFQAVKGLGLDFATRLRWVRSDVRFAEGLGGTFSEILTDSGENSCVLLIDTAEYAAMSFRLCAQIKRRKIPLIIVTDKYSHWASEYTKLALEVSTRVDLYWDSTAAISSVLNLLTHSVAEKLGKSAETRMNELEDIAGILRTFHKPPRRVARHIKEEEGEE
ncbi:MurR/RpiR family transcriptional regulator [Mesorhizobium sp.]|uniref:MurR/RpiR family transcriptional regulator n=1 Tax=Mesorhizobium sp. TaxID=1871066 RepID=UPI000FE50EE4|nr:MurR/RpiR family transcriptional regulator [Mesorhizobium sp.]RWB04526.1 MAG: MurR/RpiR family transcriptional regulator [Mesorhizobium sp.]RWB18229.1 MAG: MurR/RpiR family transcriptional regulator [Mesorhizobium sp.]RWO82670.1 MAG: MurR/RpiR family transcriptional regulator [Mesorhizobium sp.]